MASKISTRFVNQARNQAFCTGIYYQDNGQHYIVQSRNLDTAIPIEIKPDLLPLMERHPYLFVGHVRGYVDETSRKPTAKIDVFYVQRPPVGSVSKAMTAMGWLSKRELAGLDPDSPLPSYEAIKKLMMEQLDLTNEIADYILNTDQSTTTCLNRIYLSGFVGNKAFVAPSFEHDTEGYVTFQLLQFPDLDRAIPVRVMRANHVFGKMLRKGQPINVVASVAVEKRTDTEGNTTTQVYLKTDRDSVSMALSSDFENKSFPAWWRDLLQNHLATRHNGAAANGGTPTGESASQRKVRPQPVPLADALDSPTQIGDTLENIPTVDI
jgi:single-stranded DNA-binding protein